MHLSPFSCFGFQSVIISDEITAPSQFARVYAMISTITLYHTVISCLVVLHLADMDPNMNPIRLSSQSDPVIRPSHEGVPHAIGI